jgi:hypothetical protein
MRRLLNWMRRERVHSPDDLTSFGLLRRLRRAGR